MFKPIELLMYNTHLFAGSNADFSNLGGHDLDFAKLIKDDANRRKEIIQRLKNSSFDIVCLCEIWGNSYKKSIINDLEDQFRYSYYDDPDEVFAIGNGLLILSKVPLYDCRFIPFHARSGFDKHANKGMLYLNVYLNHSMQFRLIIAHTQSSHKYWTERKSNLAQINHQIENYYPNVPAIVLGDLNVYSNEQNEMREIFNGFTDAGAKTKPSFDLHTIVPGLAQVHHTNVPTYDPSSNSLANYFDDTETERFDYILFSSNDWDLESYNVIKDWRIKDGLDCSDHYPIQVKLNLRKTHSIHLFNHLIPNIYQDRKTAEEALNQKAKSLTGINTCILVQNATNDLNIRIHSYYSWSGGYDNRFHLLPFIIGPQECATLIHEGEAGIEPFNVKADPSTGCVIYRVFRSDETAVCDVFIGFTTADFLHKNKVYVEVRGLGHWWSEGSKSHMKHLIEESNYQCGDNDNANGAVQVHGTIEKGDKPRAVFKIEDYP